MARTRDTATGQFLERVGNLLRRQPPATAVELGSTLALAAQTIDTLLDVIELQRGKPATRRPVNDGLEPLREVRAFHAAERRRAVAEMKPAAMKLHRHMLIDLNLYFPDDDQEPTE